MKGFASAVFAGMLLAVAMPQAVAQQTGGQAAATQGDNVALILKEVTETAEALKQSLDELPQLIERAKNSKQEGEELLARLERLVREVTGRVDDQGQLWVQISELQDQWEKNRQRAADKAGSDARYEDIALQWEERIDRLSDLKQEIIKRRGEALTLLDDLMSQKDIILEYYELGQAELVVAALEDISDQFAVMNEGMGRMVEIAQQLGPAEEQ